MAAREYGTDPYGIISRGVPGGSDGPSVSVGRVGTPVRDFSSPDRSFGTGVGVRFGSSFGREGGGGGGGSSSVSDKLVAKTAVKKSAKGGMVKASSASKRADGIAQKGKTRGKMC